MGCGMRERGQVSAALCADFADSTKLLWGILGAQCNGSAAILSSAFICRVSFSSERVRAMRNGGAQTETPIRFVIKRIVMAFSALCHPAWLWPTSKGIVAFVTFSRGGAI